jgi:hypothetical protein
MDTAAFIVALLVFLVIGFWYVENEIRASDGAHGLFAVRAAEKPRKTRGARYAGSAEAARYHKRQQGTAASALADDDALAAATPKYRRKDRAWDRAAKLDED